MGHKRKKKQKTKKPQKAQEEPESTEASKEGLSWKVIMAFLVIAFSLILVLKPKPEPDQPPVPSSRLPTVLARKEVKQPNKVKEPKVVSKPVKRLPKFKPPRDLLEAQQDNLFLSKFTPETSFAKRIKKYMAIWALPRSLRPYNNEDPNQLHEPFMGLSEYVIDTPIENVKWIWDEHPTGQGGLVISKDRISIPSLHMEKMVVKSSSGDPSGFNPIPGFQKRKRLKIGFGTNDRPWLLTSDRKKQFQMFVYVFHPKAKKSIIYLCDLAEVYHKTGREYISLTNIRQALDVGAGRYQLSRKQSHFTLDPKKYRAILLRRVLIE